jgi:hypothetical protein
MTARQLGDALEPVDGGIVAVEIQSGDTSVRAFN